MMSRVIVGSLSESFLIKKRKYALVLFQSKLIRDHSLCLTLCLDKLV